MIPFAKPKQGYTATYRNLRKQDIHAMATFKTQDKLLMLS